MYALHRAVDSFSNFSKGPTFEEERNLDNALYQFHIECNNKANSSLKKSLASIIVCRIFAWLALLPRSASGWEEGVRGAAYLALFLGYEVIPWGGVKNTALG